MKSVKISAVIMAAIIIAAALLSSAALAAEPQYKNAGELYNARMSGGGYPDAVCGVWSNDGTMESLTIAVDKSEAGEALKQEILDMIEDDSSVTFTFRSYTYAELRAIQNELTERLGEATGAYGVGIHEDENCVVIDIDVENPGSRQFMDECFEKYHNKVRFEEGSGAVITQNATAVGGSYTASGADIGGTAGADAVRSKISPLVMAAVLCAAVLMLGGAALALRRRAGMTRRLETGGEETVSGRLSRRETERLIRKCEDKPDIPFEKIREKLESDR